MAYSITNEQGNVNNTGYIISELLFMVYLALMPTPQKQNSEEKKRINREQWIANAHEAIAAQELMIAQNKKPYKAFKDKERFFIQECMYPDGSHVMVKISAPNPIARVILNKEAYWYERVQELVNEAHKKGILIPIRFPKVVDIFVYKEHEVMITQYVVDDWVGFKNIPQEERENIILTIIDGMQKLPIPEEQLTMPIDKKLIRVVMAADYPVRAKKYLGKLVAEGVIDNKDSQTIISLIEENVAAINKFPMKLDHGDLHIGNFRYSKNPQTGEDIITLFDLEMMSIRPLFSMTAAAANFFDLAALAHVHPERDIYPEILSDIPTFNTLFSVAQMIEKIEKKFILNDKRQRDARLVYRLMRIDDCYVRLADILYESQIVNEKPNKVEIDSYKGILSQQLMHIRRERMIEVQKSKGMPEFDY